MLRCWPVGLALLIVIGSGIAHGLCSDRWSTSEELPAAVARVNRLPTTIGDWEGTDLFLDPSAIQRGEIAGSVTRKYVDRVTAQEMQVMLVCGKHGPIAVHTPDVCYQGAGYRMASDRARQVVALPSGQPAPFFKANFVKDTVPGKDELRIWWSWNGNGAWQIAAEPRFAFANCSVLYKLYVIYRVPPRDRSPADPMPAFVQQLLAEMSRTVFAEKL